MSRQKPFNVEEAKLFLIKLWNKLVQYNADAELLSQVDSSIHYDNIKIHTQIVRKDVMKQLGKVASFKLTVLDGVQDFWVT